VDPVRIRLEMSVEPIRLSLDQSIPCGLILNELISNALKHAFNDGREGMIRITLSGSEGGEISLSVADDGPGLPPNFSMSQSNTLGHQVVSTLIRQLGAKLTVQGENGARFAFTWKLAENRAAAAVPA